MELLPAVKGFRRLSSLAEQILPISAIAELDACLPEREPLKGTACCCVVLQPLHTTNVEMISQNCLGLHSLIIAGEPKLDSQLHRSATELYDRQVPSE